MVVIADGDADLGADFACIGKKSFMHPIPNCLLRYLFQLGNLGHCEEVFHAGGGLRCVNFVKLLKVVVIIP